MSAADRDQGMEPDENEVAALARVLAPAHPKLRHTAAHPSDPSGPNGLARSIARELLRLRVVAVEIEEVADDEPAGEVS